MDAIFKLLLAVAACVFGVFGLVFAWVLVLSATDGDRINYNIIDTQVDRNGLVVELAESAFTEKFPHGADGLIDCVLVVSDRDEIGVAVMERLKAKGMRVGFAGNETTSLDGERRFVRGDDLPTRIWGLVFDPACDALVVACSPSDLEAHGLPHARFGVALLAKADGLTPELRALLADHVAHCLTIPQDGGSGEVVDATIAALRR